MGILIQNVNHLRIDWDIDVIKKFLVNLKYRLLTLFILHGKLELQKSCDVSNCMQDCKKGLGVINYEK